MSFFLKQKKARFECLHINQQISEWNVHFISTTVVQFEWAPSLSTWRKSPLTIADCRLLSCYFQENQRLWQLRWPLMSSRQVSSYNLGHGPLYVNSLCSHGNLLDDGTTLTNSNSFSLRSWVKPADGGVTGIAETVRETGLRNQIQTVLSINILDCYSFSLIRHSIHNPIIFWSIFRSLPMVFNYDFCLFFAKM